MPIIPFPEPAASASYNNYAPAARVNSRGGPAARVTYYNDYLPEDI
jgi:hypothetical protein